MNSKGFKEGVDSSPRAESSWFGITRPGTHIDKSGRWWDNPTMVVTLDGKRRVSIPAALVPTSPGEQFDASFDPDEDTVILRRIKRKANWLEVWRRCPTAMDDLPPRSREMPKKLKL